MEYCDFNKRYYHCSDSTCNISESCPGQPEINPSCGCPSNFSIISDEEGDLSLQNVYYELVKKVDDLQLANNFRQVCVENECITKQDILNFKKVVTDSSRYMKTDSRYRMRDARHDLYLNWSGGTSSDRDARFTSSPSGYTKMYFTKV